MKPSPRCLLGATTRPSAWWKRRGPAQDPESHAVACDGLSGPTAHQWLWRVVSGRPVSEVTGAVLAWRASYVTDQGTRALWLIWDQASWHVSQTVRQGLTGPYPVRQERGELSHECLSAAHDKPLAQPDRADVGPWTTGRGGTRVRALPDGTPTTGLCLRAVRTDCPHDPTRLLKLH